MVPDIFWYGVMTVIVICAVGSLILQIVKR